MVNTTGARFLVIFDFLIAKLDIFIPKKPKCIDPLLSESSEEIRKFRQSKKQIHSPPEALTRLLSSLNRKKL